MVEDTPGKAEAGPPEPESEPVRIATERALKGVRSGLTFGAEAILYVFLGALAVLIEALGKIVKGTASAVKQAAPGAAAPPAEAPKQEFRVRMLPVDNYESLNATQAIAAVEGLSPDELDVLREYEAGHKNRQTVLAAIERRRKGGA